MKKCCELSTIETYKPFDIIYTEDKKRVNQVYIILRGNCTILQCLRKNVSLLLNIQVIFQHLLMQMLGRIKFDCNFSHNR